MQVNNHCHWVCNMTVIGSAMLANLTNQHENPCTSDYVVFSDQRRCSYESTTGVLGSKKVVLNDKDRLQHQCRESVNQKRATGMTCYNKTTKNGSWGGDNIVVRHHLDATWAMLGAILNPIKCRRGNPRDVSRGFRRNCKN